MKAELQRRRRWFQGGFFLLFVLAPPLDILRLDLTLGHFILFGQDWTLGIEDFLRGEADGIQAAANLLLRGFLPLFAVAALLLWTAWRFGRLYCGWLCPHFSVVEIINHLMVRASAKPGLWEPRPLPARASDAWRIYPDRRYWLLVVMAIAGFSVLWAVVFLSYLLPPFELYQNVLTARLSRNQALFLAVTSLLLAIEFTFARHLFCRYACAVGHFQSLAWMANRRAMVVGFATERAKLCTGCDNTCDNRCPMRLKPRSQKRKMFTCTQCGQCISSCRQVQAGQAGLLHWVDGQQALPVVTGRPIKGR
jgi:ferredoxin-type protein NapH